MPLTRAELAKHTIRTKIIDDPDRPGQPLDVAPVIAVRLKHEIAELRAQAEAAQKEAAPTDRGGAFATGVLATLDWLLDPDKPDPLGG